MAPSTNQVHKSKIVEHQKNNLFRPKKFQKIPTRAKIKATIVDSEASPKKSPFSGLTLALVGIFWNFLEVLSLILLTIPTILMTKAWPKASVFYSISASKSNLTSTKLENRILGPKVTLIQSDGMLKSFELKNDTLTEIWHKKLPNSNEYFSYYDQGMLYVIYADSKKDITQIDVQNPINCHRTLLNSKHPFEGSD